MKKDPALTSLKFPSPLVQERLHIPAKTEEAKRGIKHHYLVEQASIPKKIYCATCKKKIVPARNRE